MSNPTNALGLSLALGFWTQHAPAMDALYELYLADDSDTESVEDIDRDIAIIWAGERHADIVAVIEHAEADAQRFFGRAKELVVAELGRKDSPVSLKMRNVRDSWKVVAMMTPRVPHSHDESFEVSISIESSTESKVLLYVSVWRKGGKRMGSAMAGVLRDAYHGVAKGEDWHAGSAVIGAIPLTDCLVKDSGSVDLDALAERLSAVFERQDNVVLQRLVDLGREYS
jgi:hypothetical protein